MIGLDLLSFRLGFVSVRSLPLSISHDVSCFSGFVFPSPCSCSCFRPSFERSCALPPDPRLSHVSSRFFPRRYRVGRFLVRTLPMPRHAITPYVLHAGISYSLSRLFVLVCSVAHYIFLVSSHGQPYTHTTYTRHTNHHQPPARFPHTHTHTHIYASAATPLLSSLSLSLFTLVSVFALCCLVVLRSSSFPVVTSTSYLA